jgi:hypothetical protein
MLWTACKTRAYSISTSTARHREVPTKVTGIDPSLRQASLRALPRRIAKLAVSDGRPGAHARRERHDHLAIFLLQECLV